jgi:DNA invertase Pin-like site-specific DNA recombinase
MSDGSLPPSPPAEKATARQDQTRQSSTGDGKMSAHFGRFVAYYRVSTDKQGQSGLGLEAQREAVMNYLNGGTWTLVAEHTEVESGKRNARPELEKALAACRRHKAKLVIAKLDRLSRNLHFITSVMESGVEFIACDNPHANKLTIHILAAVAEHEREAISERTKAALAAAKARGVKLGNPRLAEARAGVTAARIAAADAFAANVRPNHPRDTEERREQPPRSRQGAICARREDCPRWRMDGGAGQRHSGALG